MSLDTESWKTFYIKDLYVISAGNKLDRVNMTEYDPCVNFVTRLSYNNGVDAKVDLIEGVEPFKPGLVTVALGGSYLGSCFVQEEAFYTAQNVAVLENRTPEMTHAVNLFISTLVRFESKVKYYAFGRELNTHIGTDFTIRLPIQKSKDGTPIIDESKKFSGKGYIPDWEWIENYVSSLHVKPLATKNSSKDSTNILDVENWCEFVFNRIFTLRGGYYNKKPEHSEIGRIPFLASTELNNGVTEYYSLYDIKSWNKLGAVDDTLDGKIYPGNCIAVTVNGSVCNAFYQPDEFTCSHDITVLYLKDHTLNVYLAMFLCTIITQEKYRWSYGRKPHDVKKFGESIVKLPIKRNHDGTPIIDEKKTYSDMGYLPNWEYMENYISNLPYGDRINSI